MWQQLLTLLEFLTPSGSRTAGHETAFSVGDPDGVDSSHGLGWKRFLASRVLWYAWGPQRGSPWEPYSCVTLFAALDDVLVDCKECRVGPLADGDVPDFLKVPAGAPPWVNDQTMVLLDLPGPLSVAVGYLLAATAGYQPVCTFDNWPHRYGVMKPERIIGRLLFYADAVSDLRRERITPKSPPVWLCDSDRFRSMKPAPGAFDNRYLLEERLLPGAQILLRAGITRIVYVDDADGNQNSGNGDVLQYLDDVAAQGIKVGAASTASVESWRTEMPHTRPRGELVRWSTDSLEPIRNSAGGFGGFVPQPSSGG